MSLPPELQAALLDQRIILLRGRLDDALANSVIAQLLLAGRMASASPVELHIDSPGGSLTAALSLYDVMRSLGPTVSTTCSGVAGGAVVLLLAGGAASRRFALPNARVHLSDDPVELAPGRPFDHPEAQAEEARRATARWRSALRQHTTASAETLAADMAAGRWLSASEARTYGLIDTVRTA